MGDKIYSTLFSSLASYEQQVMIEIQNEHKESKQKLKNIELARRINNGRYFFS